MFNISSQEGPVDVSKLYMVVIVKLCLEAWQDKERVENLNAHKKHITDATSLFVAFLKRLP